jgi:hypothetical protein
MSRCPGNSRLSTLFDGTTMVFDRKRCKVRSIHVLERSSLELVRGHVILHTHPWTLPGHPGHGYNIHRAHYDDVDIVVTYGCSTPENVNVADMVHKLMSLCVSWSEDASKMMHKLIMVHVMECVTQ